MRPLLSLLALAAALVLSGCDTMTSGPTTANIEPIECNPESTNCHGRGNPGGTTNGPTITYEIETRLLYDHNPWRGRYRGVHTYNDAVYGPTASEWMRLHADLTHFKCVNGECTEHDADISIDCYANGHHEDSDSEHDGHTDVTFGVDAYDVIPWQGESNVEVVCEYRATSPNGQTHFETEPTMSESLYYGPDLAL